MLQAKVSRGGRICIPTEIRKKMNIKVGDKVFFEVVDHKILISTFKTTLDKVQKIVNHYHPNDKSMVDELIAIRLSEVSRE